MEIDEIPVGRAKDLRGQKFGRLTVLYRTPDPSPPSKRVYWKCQCECGNTTIVQASNLSMGKTKSCGCLFEQYSKRKPGENWLGKQPQDLSGQRFYNLVAIEIAEKRRYGKSTCILWRCKCDCGKETIVDRNSLVKGLTKSCGCRPNPGSLKLITPGTRFGKLTVIEKVPKPPNTKATAAFYKCKCDCGGEKIVSRQCLQLGVTKSCGCLYSLGQEKISTILSNNKIFFNTEYSFVDCLGNKRPLRFDFFVSQKYLIEYDGEQHYRPTFGEQTFNITQKYDKIKNEYCKIHNIPLIRIPYWHYDKITIDDLRPETSQFLIT